MYAGRVSFNRVFGTNYDIGRSELAARVAVFSFIRVGTGFGNTGRVSPVGSCVPACLMAGRFIVYTVGWPEMHIS